MRNEFSYDVLKEKYSKRVGSYKGRDVIVRSKYDELGDNVYILYDYNNALIVDGYWIATIREDGSLSYKKATPWVKLEKQEEFDNVPQEVLLGHVSGLPAGEADTALVDSLLESAYNDILSDLMYKE